MVPCCRRHHGGAEKLSPTIRSFSASDQRRRRPVSTISRRLTWRLSVRISILTVSYRSEKPARRPSSDEYLRREPTTTIVAPVRSLLHRTHIRAPALPSSRRRRSVQRSACTGWDPTRLVGRTSYLSSALLAEAKPFENSHDGHSVPGIAATRCRHATLRELFGDVAKRFVPANLVQNFDQASVPGGSGLGVHATDGWVAELHATLLGGLERDLGALRDHC